MPSCAYLSPYLAPSVPGRNKGAQIVVTDATVRTGRGRDTWLDKNLQLVTQVRAGNGSRDWVHGQD